MQYKYLCLVLLVYHTVANRWADSCTEHNIANDLFAALNLNYPGLEKVKDAVQQHNYPVACEKLIEYYQTSSTAEWLRIPTPHPSSRKAGGAADMALNDKYNFQGTTVKIPRNAQGGLDWEEKGPQKNKEFMYDLNRHGIFETLVNAWSNTGNSIYPKLFSNLTSDWIDQNIPIASHSGTTCRTLEVGIRSKNAWPPGFFAFQGASNEEFPPFIRIKMAYGALKHAEYLMKKGLYSGNANWRATQCSGLATLAVVFPEFKNATGWINASQKSLLNIMETSVYPDGIENEQSADYHFVALEDFEKFANISILAHRQVPKEFNQILDGMYNYAAYSMDPVGFAPVNSDSDTASFKLKVLSAAVRYKRPDWLYIATNNQSGQRPTGPSPSVIFPWSGQLIMRSGYDKMSQWAWFDIGPYSSDGHGHRDKLHLSIRAYGEQYLVDSGKFIYSGSVAEKFRGPYAIHTRGHNSIVIDDRPQLKTPAIASKPLSNDSFILDKKYDYARGSISFDGINGTAQHTRALLYVRNKYWVVIDRIVSDRPRQLQALWHAHPNTKATIIDKQSFTITGTNGVLHFAIDSAKWNASIVTGQENPHPQGWYSQAKKIIKSNAFVFNRKISGNTTFAWVFALTPAPTIDLQLAIHIVSESSAGLIVDVIISKSTSRWLIPLDYGLPHPI